MDHNDIKKAIKKRYEELATESEQWYPYCFSSQNSFGAINDTENMGYSKADLESVPQESIMGLGCGNPVAAAVIKAGDEVVDLGCGGGIDVFFTSIQTGDTGRVVGIDFSPPMLKHARQGKPWPANLAFQQANALHLPFRDPTIDVTLSIGSIKHWPNQQRSTN